MVFVFDDAAALPCFLQRQWAHVAIYFVRLREWHACARFGMVGVPHVGVCRGVRPLGAEGSGNVECESKNNSKSPSDTATVEGQQIAGLWNGVDCGARAH
jgi:hypothetical protein